MSYLELIDIGSRISANLLTQDTPWESSWYIFQYGGWLIAFFVYLQCFKMVWLYWRQNLYYSAQKHVLLAIDVPRLNEQGPKAIENLFSHIYGAYKNPNLIEKWWLGYLQPRFSFELISIGGYLQYLVRSPLQFRDLVEASIYAQYPDAEITEVEDYAKSAPAKFTNTNYNMWGCEFVLYNKDYYPIRTYPAYEYALTQEFKDPAASLLEFMGKISPEENLWLQLVITPKPNDWAKKGEELVKKLIGAKVAAPKAGLLAAISTGIATNVWEAATSTLIPPSSAVTKKDEDKIRSQMLYLSPGERSTVEAVEAKISKNAFETKFRFIYWGKRGIFSKPRGVNGIIGAIAQFNTLDLNGFKPHPHTKTTIDYFFIKRRVAWRQEKLMRAYKARSNWQGWGRSILNIEELATLWHFPMSDIRTPMLKKTQAKRLESPFALPVGSPPFLTQAPQDSGLPTQPDSAAPPEATPEEIEEIVEIPEVTAIIENNPPSTVLSNQSNKSAAKKSGPPTNLPTG